MRHLIDCVTNHCWIGDCLFASSIAKKLKEREPDCHVSIIVPLVQPILLLKQNPYIDEVLHKDDDVRKISEYDKVHIIPVVDQNIPATVQFQQLAGIENTSTEFEVYTVPEFDAEAAEQIAEYRALGKPVVAVQANWEEKTKSYTKEDYEARRVPLKPAHTDYHLPRDVNNILSLLNDHVTLISVGMGNQVSQYDPDAHDSESYAYAASVIKQCDWLIGAEGGIPNLAAGVGTKCIITTDHMWLMFGPHGQMKQCPEVKLGPKVFFPDAGHVHIGPYATDYQIAQTILGHVAPESRLDKIPVFILTYRGMQYLASWFDPANYSDRFQFHIVDNGQQEIPEKFKDLVIYQTTQNIGCAGGYNLMMNIGLVALGHKKIVIAQEDGQFTEEQLRKVYDGTKNNIMMGAYDTGFDMAIMGITEPQFDTIGPLDENFIFARSEDVDWLHRAKLKGIYMQNLGYSPRGNVSVVKDQVVDSYLDHNKQYVISKWGGQPAVWQHAFQDPSNDPAKPPFTKRLLEIYGDITEYPSVTEFRNYLTTTR